MLENVDAQTHFDVLLHEAHVLEKASLEDRYKEVALEFRKFAMYLRIRATEVAESMK